MCDLRAHRILSIVVIVTNVTFTINIDVPIQIVILLKNNTEESLRGLYGVVLIWGHVSLFTSCKIKDQIFPGPILKAKTQDVLTSPALIFTRDARYLLGC